MSLLSDNYSGLKWYFKHYCATRYRGSCALSSISLLCLAYNLQTTVKVVTLTIFRRINKLDVPFLVLISCHVITP